MKLIKKHVSNMDASFETCDEKAHDLVNRVNENDDLTKDEKTAWLENIKIMRAYYYQYVINKRAYEIALEALGDEIHDSYVEEVQVPMFKNYGIVLIDLVTVLANRKVPISAEVKIEQTHEGLVGKLLVTHS